MIPFRDLPIRRKLTVIVTLTTGAALVLTSTIFVSYDLIRLRQELRQRIAMLAQVIGANSTASLTFEDRPTAEETLETLGAQDRITEAAIYEKDGSLFAHYARDAAGAVAVPQRPGRDGSRFEAGRLVEFAPMMLAGERIGTVYLAFDLEEMRGSLLKAATTMVVVTGAALFVALLLLSRLQRVISDPVADLSR